MSYFMEKYPFNRNDTYHYCTDDQNDEKLTLSRNIKHVEFCLGFKQDMKLRIMSQPMVETVSISGRPEDIRMALSCPNIKHLNISGDLYYESLVEILYENRLVSLGLPFGTGKYVFAIVSGMSTLKCLYLIGSELSMENARFLCLMKNLQILDIEDVHVSNDVLQFLLDNGSFQILYLGFAIREHNPLGNLYQSIIDFLTRSQCKHPPTMNVSKFTQPWPHIVKNSGCMCTYHGYLRIENPLTQKYADSISHMLTVVFPDDLIEIIIGYACIRG